MRKWLIKKLNGFCNIDDAIKHIKEIDDRERKKEILSEAVKHLYNAISADDILHQNPDGTWMFLGKPLTGVEVSNLKEEAAMIRGMKLWFAIKQDIRFQIGKKIWEEAKVMDDILWGQLLVFLDDIIRNRINKM